MSPDFYDEARRFVLYLYHEEKMPCIEVAKVCDISWGVASAIVNQTSYDMGTQNYRRILRRKIEWDKRAKQQRNAESFERIMAQSYKGNRDMNHVRKVSEIERMKPL